MPRIGAFHGQCLTAHLDCGQVGDDLGRHASRQSHEAVIGTDVDAIDLTAFQPPLVTQRADDLARFDAMPASDGQTPVFLGIRILELQRWQGLTTRRELARRVFALLRRAIGRVGVVATGGLRARGRGSAEHRHTCIEHRRQCHGQVQRVAAGLVCQLGDGGAQLLDRWCGQGCNHALLEALIATGMHCFDARQIHLFDGLACSAFDQPQHVALARCDEQDRITAATGTTGAADTMYIRLGVVGHIKVDHVADALDIKAAGGHIGGHQNVDLAGLELADDALAQCLRHITVECHGREAASLQFFSKFRGALFGAGKHQHGVEGFDF